MGGDICIQFDGRRLDDLFRRLRSPLRNLPEALAGAVNDATASEVPDISQDIRQVVNITPRALDPKITRVLAEPSLQPSGGISLSGKRFPLKVFDALQQKTGVSYRIVAATGFVPGAFIGRGGDVLRRDGDRFIRLYGPSPWQMLVKSGLLFPSVQRLERKFTSNTSDRIAKLFQQQYAA